MKQRKRRKLVQAQVRHGNRWGWSLEKFVRRVAAACKPFNEVMAEVYENARRRMENEATQ